LSLELVPLQHLDALLLIVLHLDLSTSFDNFLCGARAFVFWTMLFALSVPSCVKQLLESFKDLRLS